MLTMRAYMHFHGGPNLLTNRRAIAYEVDGLPVGERAWIAEIRHSWCILRETGGVLGHWSGEHATANEALSVVAHANSSAAPHPGAMFNPPRRQ